MPHELHFIMQYSNFVNLHFSASNIYRFIPANCYAPHTLNASPSFTPHYATVCGSVAPSMYVSLTEWNSYLCDHKLLTQTDLKDSHN